MYGPIMSGYTLRVRCTTEACPKPADTEAQIYSAGQGVAMMPLLLCTGCWKEVSAVRPEGAKSDG